MKYSHRTINFETSSIYFRFILHFSISALIYVFGCIILQVFNQKLSHGHTSKTDV